MRKPYRDRRNSRKKRNWIILGFSVLSFALLALVLLAVNLFNLFPKDYYTAKHFGIETLKSPLDANGNGKNDFEDILLGARKDAKNKPQYNGSYWEDGYPPDNIGVCTDVVWRAMQNAGYDLKTLVDTDIAENPLLYPGLDVTGPDPNIDFRRVRNLQVFFERHAQQLTTSTDDIAEWQPGDIVIFKGKTDHIGIISDKRNADGVPWLIHNSGQPEREEDAIGRLTLLSEIVGHYRWVPQE